jgi:hypothetical protein
MAKNYSVTTVTDQYVVTWDMDTKEEVFTGVDADKRAKAFADDLADKNTSSKPSGWPTIMKVVKSYGRIKTIN